MGFSNFGPFLHIGREPNTQQKQYLGTNGSKRNSNFTKKRAQGTHKNHQKRKKNKERKNNTHHFDVEWRRAGEWRSSQSPLAMKAESGDLGRWFLQRRRRRTLSRVLGLSY